MGLVGLREKSTGDSISLSVFTVNMTLNLLLELKYCVKVSRGIPSHPQMGGGGGQRSCHFWFCSQDGGPSGETLLNSALKL